MELILVRLHPRGVRRLHLVVLCPDCWDGEAQWGTCLAWGSGSQEEDPGADMTGNCQSCLQRSISKENPVIFFWLRLLIADKKNKSDNIQIGFGYGKSVSIVLFTHFLAQHLSQSSASVLFSLEFLGKSVWFFLARLWEIFFYLLFSSRTMRDNCINYRTRVLSLAMLVRAQWERSKLRISSRKIRNILLTQDP